LKDSVKLENKVLLDTTITSVIQDDDCVRSIPEPIIDTTKFPNVSFVLKNRVGYETLKFDNGDILEIKNAGCEYYSIVFCFKTSEYIADSTDFRGSCESIIKLLEKIKDAQKSAIDINNAISALKAFEENANNNLKSEIIIRDDEIREFAIINQIKKISSKNLYLKFKYRLDHYKKRALTRGAFYAGWLPD
jgi:hypothetical protein